MSYPEARERFLTGGRPTGRPHLGHYAGSLRERVALQHHHDQAVLIADLQALIDNAGRAADVGRSSRSHSTISPWISARH